MIIEKNGGVVVFNYALPTVSVKAGYDIDSVVIKVGHQVATIVHEGRFYINEMNIDKIEYRDYDESRLNIVITVKRLETYFTEV